MLEWCTTFQIFGACVCSQRLLLVLQVFLSDPPWARSVRRRAPCSTRGVLAGCRRPRLRQRGLRVGLFRPCPCPRSGLLRARCRSHRRLRRGVRHERLQASRCARWTACRRPFCACSATSSCIHCLCACVCNLIVAGHAHEGHVHEARVRRGGRMG